MPPRAEVIMAGVGGRGVLMAGQLLAQAAMSHYQHVSWFPSYASAMRGGPCECTVILSPEPIASPLIGQAEAVVVIEPSQMRPYEARVKPGGIMIVESTGLKEGVTREDLRVLRIPGVEMAVGLGNTQVSNLILLGAYVQATTVVPAELIEGELERRFQGREALLSLNRKAFRHGLEAAEKIQGR